MKASIAIQILPQVSDKNELVRIVDEVIDYIRSTGLRYEVGPFETAIEGDDMDQLMDIAKECQKVASGPARRRSAPTSRWTMSPRARS